MSRPECLRKIYFFTLAELSLVDRLIQKWDEKTT